MMIYRFCFKIIAFITLFAIIIGSLAPLPETPQYLGNDKLHHILGYGFLTFCFMQCIYSTRYRILSAIAIALLGVLIECIQPMFNRYFEYADMLANTIGIMLGLVSGGLFYSMIKRLS